MAASSLEEVIQNNRNAVSHLRNSKVGMYVYPVVAPEFTNWRDEQRAWRDTAILFDQTHHMDELIVEGPDAEAFLSQHGFNSFANLGMNRAKLFVPVTPNGHVIGGHIIFREREDNFILVGRAPTANWLKFCAAVGKWSVRVTHDPRSPSRPNGERVMREHYRVQIQGPEANAIFEKMKGATHRKKVTFEWNAEDVVNIIASAFKPGEDHFKWIDFPQPNYASSSTDMVMRDGKMVGMSMSNGYSYNERCMLSLGVVDADVQVGDVLTMLWGEPETTGKTSTEKHKQAEIRACVSPTPYSAEARDNYSDSWRTR